MKSELAILGGTPVRTSPFATWPVYGTAEEQALLRVLHSGKWGKLEGTEVATFEKRFAEYHQAKHGIAVVNGTVSLRIALMAAGIEAGDEVIIPPYTFLATASTVIEANATPVFVDIDRETFNIDAKLIEKAITPRTRAIICVHVGGMACDMDAIMGVAKSHNLIVIEDAAHAHGSEFQRPQSRRDRAHRVVLVSVEQKHDQRRGRDSDLERRCAGGKVPLDPQLRARARREVV